MKREYNIEDRVKVKINEKWCKGKIDCVSVGSDNISYVIKLDEYNDFAKTYYEESYFGYRYKSDGYVWCAFEEYMCPIEEEDTPKDDVLQMALELLNMSEEEVTEKYEEKIKIAKLNELKGDTAKEVGKAYGEHCCKITCSNCDYNNKYGIACGVSFTIDYLFDNYNITKKDE